MYEYDVKSELGRDYKGLLLELQYRTSAQHAWATCVEVVGLITESQPKFQRGDTRYEIAMALASEMIARHTEGMTSCFPDIADDELVKQFDAMDEELQLLNLLRKLHAENAMISPQKNMILIFSDDALQVRTYRRSSKAMQALFRFEQENPGKDIVLVRADRTEDVRNAFRNYFSDARDFLKLIGDARLRIQSLEGLAEHSGDTLPN